MSLKMGEITTPFDENDVKFWVCCRRLHIRAAARLTSVLLILLVAADFAFSFGRSTAVMFYSWIAACFALGIYGSLAYGVFKEKKLFTLPFLVFQAIFVTILSFLWIILCISALFSRGMIHNLALDLGAVSPTASGDELASQLRVFIVVYFITMSLFMGIQYWFFEIIYRFFQFLKERETSFNFNLDSEFHIAD